MNEKRTLWILAAVGVFLLVVVSVAAIAYRPTNDDSDFLLAANPASSVWAGNAVETEVKQPTPTPPPPPTPATENTDVLSEAGGLTVITGTTNVYSTGTTATFDLTTTTSNTSTTPTTSSNSTKSENTEKAPVRTEPIKPAATESKAQVKPAAPAKTSASTKPAAAKPAPAKPAVSAAAGNFWVQAAAFTQKQYAENARAVLGQNQMQSEIFTFSDGKGTTFYRLRVGPYTTKNEADFWKNRIALIDDFKNAQTVTGDK